MVSNAAEEVIKRLRELADNANDSILAADNPQYYDGYEDGVLKAIEIIKEELAKAMRRKDGN